jgi:CRISPR type I-E-associated protein CasB/Cse2
MTAETTTPEQAYIEWIENLDPGHLAALRRGCGERDPVEGRCPWLHAGIRGVATEPVAFLVASLLAQYSTAKIRVGAHRLNPAAEGESRNFGDTWKRAIAGTDSDSIKRRFHILLDSEYDPTTGDGDLPYRLRQMVRYAASKGIGVDWPQLLIDLKFWSQPDKRVQKSWARRYFANEPREGEAKTDLEGETIQNAD